MFAPAQSLLAEPRSGATPVAAIAAIGNLRVSIVQRRQQAFGRLQIRRIEALGKTLGYRLLNSTGAPPLSVGRPQPRQVDGTAQFPRSCTLTSSPIEGLDEVILRVMNPTLRH
jgi:hypothetical protein